MKRIMCLLLALTMGVGQAYPWAGGFGVPPAAGVMSFDGTTLTLTGALSVSGAATVGGTIDAPDIEVATISARDGTTVATFAGGTGAATYANKVTANGLETAAGYGVGVGTTAPTTNAIDFAPATAANPATGVTRFMSPSAPNLNIYGSSGGGTFNANIMYATASMRAPNFANAGYTGPPQFPFGLDINAMAEPASPTAPYDRLYVDVATSKLSHKTSAGTTEAYAVEP